MTRTVKSMFQHLHMVQVLDNVYRYYLLTYFL